MKIRLINILVLIVVTLVLVSIVSVHAAMPGFDCSKATTEVEKLVCSDDRLADLDKQMADVFRALLSGLGENEKKAVKKEQNLWLKSRQKMLDASPSREDKLKTLSELYETKIAELNLKAELSVKTAV
ncbi:lysozyme inhibitor LprI family protein [Desulforegula conservatrix]|uniref:lysozyme inhibitor LprI family protein n=1 Tax=Desulforegula conservatrix TaxID=153026 RepID=UPI000401E023|nr:lysozyme inhibitor LprI family protein [Desulforegula conservatrix]